MRVCNELKIKKLFLPTKKIIKTSFMAAKLITSQRVPFKHPFAKHRILVDCKPWTVSSVDQQVTQK